MPAPDGPQFQLFHGTPMPFPPGTRKVRPSLQGGDPGGYEGQRVAFATSDLDEAKIYGPHVYEVAHDEHTQEGWANTYYSEKGFKIIRKLD